MFTVHHYPQRISKYQLDQYLSQGWFRMAQSIFTCYFLHIKNNVYSTVWVRLNLHEHEWSKRQRKVMRRVESRFEISVQEAVINTEKEQLYKRYKAGLEEDMAASISTSLMNGMENNIYDTYEVAIRDNGKLIGVSFFDLGDKASASIMGVYDPDYQKFSLGYYTMLREIIFSKTAGMDYYYPGYVVPGYRRFDYKLRIGNVDYYLPETRSWKPYTADNISALLSERLKKQMNHIYAQLVEWEIPVEMMFFPSPPMLFSLIDNIFISSPLCVLCHPVDGEEYPLMIDFDAKENKFCLYRAGIVLELLYETHNEKDIIKEALNYYT